MKKLMNRMERFCCKHPRFGVPRLMLWIVAATVAVWILMMMDTTGMLYSSLCFDARAILHGQVWRLVTFLFVNHTASVLFFAIEMYFYYWIGSVLEREWGVGMFTFYYLIGWALTAAYGLIVGGGAEITSTYLHLSLFLAFATLYPNAELLLFFIIPVKAKWLGWADAVLLAYFVITSPWPARLLPIVAVVNYFIFCGGWLFDFFKPAQVQQRKKIVDFRRETDRIRYEQKNRSYRHRCEVCGKTDAEYPDLEFRYCSRCKGYHCYCAEHITNHVHVTEE